MRDFPRVLLLLVGLSLPAGCGNPPAPEEEEAGDSFAGVTVSVVVPENLGLEDAWRVRLDEWQAMTKADTRLATTGTWADLDDDVIVLPWHAFADFQETRGFAPLPEELSGEDAIDWLGVLPALRTSVPQRQGAPLVIPVCSPVLVCYYRSDLLEAAGLQPPRTWEEYQELAAGLPDWAPGLGVAEPWGETFRATLFLARAAAAAKHPGNISFLFDMATGKPTIDTAGFQVALEQSQTLLQTPAAAECLKMTLADSRAALLSGKAALGIAVETDPENAPLVFGPSPAREQGISVERPEGGTLGFVPLPGSDRVYNQMIKEWEEIPNRATLTGFAGLVVGVSAKTPPERRLAAWNLIAEVAVHGVEQNFPGPAHSLCRETQIAAAAAWTGHELSSSEQLGYSRAVADSLGNGNAVRTFPTVGAARFREALTEGLTSCLTGEATPEAALKQVHATWDEIAKELGPSKVLNSYRISLGRPVLN